MTTVVPSVVLEGSKIAYVGLDLIEDPCKVLCSKAAFERIRQPHLNPDGSIDVSITGLGGRKVYVKLQPNEGFKEDMVIVSIMLRDILCIPAGLTPIIMRDPAPIVSPANTEGKIYVPRWRSKAPMVVYLPTRPHQIGSSPYYYSPPSNSHEIFQHVYKIVDLDADTGVGMTQIHQLRRSSYISTPFSLEYILRYIPDTVRAIMSVLPHDLKTATRNIVVEADPGMYGSSLLGNIMTGQGLKFARVDIRDEGMSVKALRVIVEDVDCLIVEGFDWLTPSKIGLKWNVVQEACVGKAVYYMVHDTVIAGSILRSSAPNNEEVNTHVRDLMMYTGAATSLLSIPALTVHTTRLLLEQLASSFPQKKGIDYTSIARALQPASIGKIMAACQVAYDYEVMEKLKDMRVDTREYRRAAGVETKLVAALDTNSFLATVNRLPFYNTGISTMSSVEWESIGGTFKDALLSIIREKFVVTLDIKSGKRTIKDRINQTGALLYGVPGVGKTVCARAVCGKLNAELRDDGAVVQMYYVKGGEVLNKYVGETNALIRALFSRARASQFAIIFFDEVEVLAPTRNTTNENQNITNSVETLLSELDDGDKNTNIFVIGATNRPEIVDPAIIRPGRLGFHMHVERPTRKEAVSILESAVVTIIDKLASKLNNTNNTDISEGKDGSEYDPEALVAAMEVCTGDDGVVKCMTGADIVSAIDMLRMCRSKKREDIRITNDELELFLLMRNPMKRNKVTESTDGYSFQHGERDVIIPKSLYDTNMMKYLMNNNNMKVEDCPPASATTTAAAAAVPSAVTGNQDTTTVTRNRDTTT